MLNEIQILNNGYPMPSVGLGVYKISDEDMTKVVNAAIDAGYRAFDTAYFYDNEASLGRALKDNGVDREDLFITTKLWNDYQGYYLDLFLIHWPCEADGLFLETYKAMEELYEQGKVKAIGVCNFNVHHLEKLMAQSSIKPMVNQIEVHPYFNQQELQEFCDRHDIKVTAWMPLMRNRGLLDNPVIVKIAEKYHKTPAQVVLRWHLAHNRIIIPKSQTPKRIQENIDILDFNLELTEVAEIDALNRNARQGKNPDDVKIGDLK